MRKKLFAVIMSAMMMITFMPTMAFAAGSCAHPEAIVKFASWSADYSEANFKVVCTNTDCIKVMKTFSLETTRLFDATDKNGQNPVDTEFTFDLAALGASESAVHKTETGAIYTYVKVSDVNTKAQALLSAAGITSTLTNLTSEYKMGADDVYLTTYYDFKDSTLCAQDGTTYAKMGADEYLNYKSVLNSNAYIKLTEPTTIDSYDKKPRTAVVTFNSYINDKSAYYAAAMRNTRELFVSSDANHYLNLANRDVRLDITAPEYAPYEDNVTVGMKFNLKAFADIEKYNDVRLVNVAGETTQNVSILTDADHLDLDHYIYKVKGEALPEVSGDASGTAKKLDVRKFSKVWDNEAEAKRAQTGRTLFGPLTYIGEDVAFEIATKNVTVQYGAIDAVGNVTWSNEAPVIKDLKANPEGFYNDKDYHFLVKVTKGSKTVYAHMVVKMAPADLMYGFANSALYVGQGQKLDKMALLGMKVMVGEKKNLKEIYACDADVAKSIMEKYMDIDSLSKVDTTVKGSRTLYATFDNSQMNKDSKTDENLAQFLVNYDFDEFKGTATLYIQDESNDITTYGLWKKTFHVKNAKGLKATKKFKVKARTVYGDVTFQKQTGNKKIKVNKTTGQVTVKKGLKKGTYKVKVQLNAPNCHHVTKKIVVKIKK